MNSGPIVETVGLSVRYGEVRAVEAASLAAGRGEITALLGPSGCGKTSLLRAIAGFEVPTEGLVRIDSVTVAGDGRWVAPERRTVGMVFQQGALFPHLDVRANVRFGVERRADADSRVREALQLVGMAGLERRLPHELSGGQQQRVALARALAPAPQVVLLDEPFANLDAALRLRVREEVREILEHAGLSAILVTHDQDEALSLAQRVAVMDRGRIAQIGAPEEIYERPATTTVAAFVGEGQFLRCRMDRGRLDCALGRYASDAPDGDGLLLVRPEDLRIESDAAAGGVSATLLRRRFFGHDSIHEVQLASDELLRVRVLGGTGAPEGSRVRLRLQRRVYSVYDTDDGSRVGQAEPS